MPAPFESRRLHRHGHEAIPQAVQLTDGVAGLPLPMKPHETLPPAPTLPLKPTLEAVTFVVPETPAFQELAIDVPEGKLQFTVHFEMDDEPAVTVTSPCQPPDQVPTTLIDAEHAPVPPPPLLLVVVVVGSPPPP